MSKYWLQIENRIKNTSVTHAQLKGVLYSIKETSELKRAAKEY